MAYKTKHFKFSSTNGKAMSGLF